MFFRYDAKLQVFLMEMNRQKSTSCFRKKKIPKNQYLLIFALKYF